MIVDDAFVTGTRLYQYSQHLRYLHSGYRGRVHFLVAIARPPSIGDWIDAQKLLSYRRPKRRGEKLLDNTVNAIEMIVLPNWDSSDCPWCVEAERLHDYAAFVADMPELFKSRLEMLRQQQQGLTDNLFLQAPHHLPIRLSKRGVFIKNPPNQATAFAAVAGGLQRLRTDSDQVPPLGRHRYPLATVLKSVEYLSNVYNDSILRAAFFRAAGRDELCYHDPIKEEQRAIFARDDINNVSGQIYNTVLELCWQVLEGKLPGEVFEKVNSTRFQELGVAEETEFLNDILAVYQQPTSP